MQPRCQLIVIIAGARGKNATQMPGGNRAGLTGACGGGVGVSRVRVSWSKNANSSVKIARNWPEFATIRDNSPHFESKSSDLCRCSPGRCRSWRWRCPSPCRRVTTAPSRRLRRNLWCVRSLCRNRSRNRPRRRGRRSRLSRSMMTSAPYLHTRAQVCVSL